MTLVQQMANIGSEVDRAIGAHAAGRADRFDHAVARALQLFDLSAADARWRGPRRREILRSREAFCALLFDPDAASDSGARMSAYFLQFAVAARRPGAPR
jgi:hypothetical protein